MEESVVDSPCCDAHLHTPSSPLAKDRRLRGATVQRLASRTYRTVQEGAVERYRMGISRQRPHPLDARELWFAGGMRWRRHSPSTLVRGLAPNRAELSPHRRRASRGRRRFSASLRHVTHDPRHGPCPPRAIRLPTSGSPSCRRGPRLQAPHEAYGIRRQPLTAESPHGTCGTCHQTTVGTTR